MSEEEQHQAEHREPGGWGERGASPLELVLLAVPLVLLVVFVLWAGRGGRAGLVSDLAAGEAAVVASLCCEDGEEGAEEREQVVEDVLSARPGLGFLCIGGPRPAALENDEEFVDEAWLENFDPPESEIRGATRGVGAVGVRFECETDGAVAPLRGLFPTVSFFGQAAEVVAIPPRPILEVGKGEGDEGHTGDTNKIEFVIELAGPAAQDVFIIYWTDSNWTSDDPDPPPNTDTATAVDDYTAIPEPAPPAVPERIATIAAGEVRTVVEVEVTGDDAYERDEAFLLRWFMRPSDPCAADVPDLSDSATGNSPLSFTCQGDPQMPIDANFNPADYWTGQPAVGTIKNDDDPPGLRVMSTSPPKGHPEGNSGQSEMEFTVELVGETEVGGVQVTAKTRPDNAVGARQATAGADCTVTGADYATLGEATPTPVSSTNPATFKVVVCGDLDGEYDETFELQAFVAAGPVETPDVEGGRFYATGVGKIEDDEPKIRIAATDAAGDEGKTLEFTVSLDVAPPPGQTVEVKYGVGDGTSQPADLPADCTWGPADAGADYTATYTVDSPGTLTFNPGETAKKIEVRTTDDDLDEHCWETLEVTLFGQSSNSRLVTASAVGTIRDNDNPPTLSLDPPAAVDEGDPVKFTARLSAASSFDVGFGIATLDDTAEAPDDYTPILSRENRRETIAAGDRTFEFTVDTKTDGYVEADEFFNLVVVEPAHNAVLASDPLFARATIRDATRRHLYVDDATEEEGIPLSFKITLNNGTVGPITQAVTFNYEVVEANIGCPDACATEDDDYRHEDPHTRMGSVTFPARGATELFVEVDTFVDDKAETDEKLYLNLQLSTPEHDGFLCGDCQGTGTIENFPLPVLSVTGAEVDEGGVLGFAVELSPKSTRATTFNVYTWALTAGAGGDGDCAGADYHGDIEGTGRKSSVTIPADADKAEGGVLSVQTCSDPYLEPSETLLARIADPENAVISADAGVGIGIIKDVLPREVFVKDANAAAGDEMGFEVRLTRPATAEFTVYYSTRPGTARPAASAGDGDYSNANEADRGDSARGRIDFKVGDVSRIAGVQTWPDDELSDEAFRLDIALGDGTDPAIVVLGDSIAVGTIKPRYSLLEIANADAEEGSPVEFTVTRRGRTDQRSEVEWFTQDLATAARPAESGTACGNACDYTAASGALIFEAGDAEQTISVATRKDQLDEWPNEQFAVRLHTPVNAAVAASAAVGTIDEECVDPTVADSETTVTGENQTVQEGAGQATVVFKVFPAVCPASPATASYATGPPSGAGYTAATAGADYTEASGTAQVEGNRIVFDVAVLDDALDEDNEAFEVAIGSWTVPARWPAATPATITIQDDDAEPEVSVYEASAVEGQVVRFSVRLDRPSGRTVTVPYSTHPLTATRGLDYRHTTGTLTFAAGDTEEFAEVVALTDDDGGEGDEQFQLRLGIPVNAVIDVGTAIGTIVDRTQPGLSIKSNYEDTGTKASEGGMEVFTVTLDEASTNNVTVEYATVELSGDGAATAGDDFAAATDTLTFVPGEALSQEFSVAIRDDNVPEGDERFQARLLRPVNAVIGDGVAATVIAGQCADPANADHLPPTLSVAGASIDEDHPTGTMAFALTIDRPLCSEAAISVSRTHTTTSAADFAGIPAAAAFPAGVTSAVYQGIVVADDDLPEGDETFGVAVSWAAGPTSWRTAAAATATGTIIDDDKRVAISIAAASGAEGTTLSFPVTLDRAVRQDVEVEFRAVRRYVANYAEPGTDFTAVSGKLTIAAGAISGAVEVPALRDDVDGEPDETFRVELHSPSSHAEFSVASAVGTITDVPTPKVYVSDAEAEEGQILEFRVALDIEGTEPVKVEYTTVQRSGSGAATSGEDYLHVSGTLTFAPGETLKTVLVAALADDEPGEGDETLQLRLSNPVSADLGDPLGIGVIRNLGEPAISVADRRAEEGQSVVFTITLSNRANQDITVDYVAESRRTAGDVAATEGDDYNAVSGTATIAAGATSATVAVATVDDRLDEYDEVFALNLKLRDGDYGTLDDASATGTIEDNDGEPSISVADTAAAEDAGVLAVAVSLDAPSGRTVAVDYAISPGTATLGDDYEAAPGVPLSGTVAISAGRVSAALSVALIDDDDTEGAETLTISLSNPRNATLAAGTATLTILDDEGPPTAYLDPDPAGSPEGQDAEIALRLSGPSEQTVTVKYRTRGGTATAGADYTAVADGTATFAPGDTVKTLSTPTEDDDDEEEDETVGWEIHTPTNAQLAQATGTSVILDDDGVPRIIVDDARATEGGQAAFTIRLSAPADEEVTVAYRTEADAFAGAAAATPEQDFTTTSGTATFAAGDQTATVQVALPDDALDEGAETFWLRLDAATATGAAVADAVAIGTIDDNDPLPALSITDATAAEGAPVQFAVALSAPSGRTVRVRYAPQPHDKDDPDREATPVDDYDPTAKTLVIPAGTTNAVAEVQAYEDQITEYEETFLVRLYNPGHATITSATATGTIVDKTGLPQATIADAQTAEGSGTLSVPVTLSHSSAQTVTIAYTTRTTGTGTDDATAGDDFTAATGTLTIAPGATTATIDIAITDDDTVEADETFSVQLRNPQQTTIIRSEATATIIDDDGLPRISITGAQAAEDAGAIALTVSLTHTSTGPVTVEYDTFDNTAIQRLDYTPTTGTLTFAPGDTTAAVNVPIIDDLIDENSETITVRLTNPTAATVLRTAAAATATINDNDPAPQIRLLPATAREGRPLQFAALLDAPSGLTVQAQYATRTTGTGSGHATPRADYTSAQGTVQIPPGRTTATIPVATLTDARTEIPETLQLALTDPQNTTLHPTDHTAVGTINDSLVPTLAVSDATALEGNPLVFALELSQPSDTNVTMTISVRNISATGSDYQYTQPNRGQFTIPAGQTSASYSVATFTDTFREDTETMLLVLGSVSNNVELLDGIAIGTIFDDQSAGLSVGDASATEGGALTFTVSLDRRGGDNSEVTVAYRTKPQTAAEGTDYIAATGTLVFSSDTASAPVTVRTSQDTLSEANEVFFVELQSPTGAVLHDHLGSGTINDDDPVPVLSIGAAQTDEGTPLVFTATLNSASGRRITADYRTRAATATSGVDYLPAIGTVEFPVGSTSQDISVVTLPDQQDEPDETLEMVISNVVGATVAASGTATGTIIDSTIPALTVADASAREGDPLEFVVTLNRQHDTAVTVGYATADATATAAGGDYVRASGNLVFEPGDTQKTVSVTTLVDTRDEPAETLTLSISYTGTAIRIIDGSATGTIRSKTLPAISIRDADQIEGQAMAFHVQLSHPPEETATVAWRTVNGTAAAPGDYRTASGTLTFAPGQASRTISITIQRDYTDEEDRETFFLELSNPTDALLESPTIRATGTIYDVDRRPQISISTHTSGEGNSEYESSINVVRDFAATSREITVDWELQGLPLLGFDAATEGEDFRAGSGTLRFHPDNRVLQIPVTIVGDRVYENTETIAVVLSNPVNATLSNTTGMMIMHNDEPYVHNFSGGSAREGNSVTFTIESALGRARVEYKTVEGTAKENVDYTPKSGVIFVGNRYVGGEATISIDTTSDSIAEGAERFTLELSTRPDTGIETNSIATGTIVDGTTRVVSVRNARSSGIANEGYGSADFVVYLDSAADTPVTVDYELIDGTARINSDYRDASGLNGKVTIPTGDTEAVVRVEGEYDGVYEDQETFQIRISNPQGAVIGTDTATATIESNDSQPRVSVANTSVQEGEDAQFAVRLTRRSERGTRVTYATSDGSAKAGTDYTSQSGTLTFGSNETLKYVSVPTSENSTMEDDKTFNFTLSNPHHADIADGGGSAFGRIIDDDCVDPTTTGFVPPTLAIASASANEGDALSFEVSVSKPFCSDVASAVSVSVALGTASSDDVTTPSGAVGFKAGETTATYSGVTTVEDSLDEPDETVVATASWHPSLNVGAAYSAVSVSATGTIVDDDDAPTLEILNATAAEAGELLFIVTLDAPSGKQVTVEYATARGVGTATAVDDYKAVSGTLTFEPGQTTKQVVVETEADALDEHDETFQLKLSNPTNATIDDATGVGIIEDDDPLPTVSIANASAAEGGTLRLTITLSAVSGRDVVVVYATADDSEGANQATAGDDYTAKTATARIVAGNRTTTIGIAVAADTDSEPNETFLVKLLAASPDNTLKTTHATIHATAHTATATITNVD